MATGSPPSSIAAAMTPRRPRRMSASGLTPTPLPLRPRPPRHRHRHRLRPLLRRLRLRLLLARLCPHHSRHARVCAWTSMASVGSRRALAFSAHPTHHPRRIPHHSLTRASPLPPPSPSPRLATAHVPRPALAAEEDQPQVARRGQAPLRLGAAATDGGRAQLRGRAQGRPRLRPRACHHAAPPAHGEHRRR